MINFLVVGAEKCATTSLFKYLNEHPEISMPPQKEIGFFARDNEYEKGKDWYEGNFPNKSSKESNKMILGEVSPQYMFTFQAPFRIKKHYPHTKIIMILRNPIDRAFSAYKMLSNRKTLNMSFSDAIKDFIKVNENKMLFGDFKTVNFLEAGHYSLMVKRYTDLFPRENIFIAFTEDLDSQPDILMTRIYDFLSVEKNFNNTLIKKKFHEGGVIKYSALNKLLDYISQKDLKIITFLQNLFPGTGYWLRQWNIKKDNKQSILKKDRLSLIKYYSKDVKELKKYLNQELPWKDFR
jgi:hypothetical protein